MKRILFKSNLSRGVGLLLSLLILASPDVLFATTHETTKITIPATMPALWKAIDEHSTALNQAIKEGKLNLVHEHAFAIRDLANGLPPLSKNLSQEQKKTLQDTLGFINQLAGRLDKTGDANDKEGTLANWAKLQKLLNQLRALYQLPVSH
ncbi:chemiosmotic efflux system C protein A [Legionella beliardensis]|uniref:Chemiosmotic efflux system C protein A n=1 Tax=Legionella beliardensis TaxID=91822 RepID=A0A378JNY1_9GAMM|nr:transporter [Legionella beliardensis]STX55482.1 chemiosmotic efflux system C protein A [Legionella beliardensis]